MAGLRSTAVVIAIGIGLAMFLGGGERAAPIASGPPVTFDRSASAPEQLRLRRRRDGHFYVHGNVNGQVVEFLVDTGATDVVLTTADADRVGLAVDPKNYRVIGSGASGAVHGQVDRTDSIEVGGRRLVNAQVMVAEGLEMSLLGQDFLGRLDAVQMSGDFMVLR